MPINIKIQGLDKLAKKASDLRNARKDFRSRLLQHASLLGLDVVRHIRRTYMSGPRPGKLGTVSGQLRARTRSRVSGNPEKILMRFGNPLPYARIHEYGGKTKAHTIRPKKKGFLAFQKSGKWIYSTTPIQHPGSNIPARPYLRPGIKDMLPTIKSKLFTMLQQTARQGLHGGK